MAERDMRGNPELSFSVQDERLPINATIITDEGEVKLKFYFNPANIRLPIYISAINRIFEEIAESPTDMSDEDYSEYAANKVAELDANIDGIFGAGASVEIFRYSGAEFYILNNLLEMVKKGQKYFEDKRAEIVRKERATAAAAAKAEAKAFIAKL